MLRNNSITLRSYRDNQYKMEWLTKNYKSNYNDIKIKEK